MTKADGPEKLQRHAGFSAALIEGKLQPARMQGVTTHVHRGTIVVMQGFGACVIAVHPTLGADHGRFIRHKFFGSASQSQPAGRAPRSEMGEFKSDQRQAREEIKFTKFPLVSLKIESEMVDRYVCERKCAAPKGASASDVHRPQGSSIRDPLSLQVSVAGRGGKSPVRCDIYVVPDRG